MISFGIDELIIQNPAWKSTRIGLVTNDAATIIRELDVRIFLVL